MNKAVSIIGAGGHTRSIINLLELNDYEILGIYDDSFRDHKAEDINGYPIVGNLDNINNAFKNIVLSFGNNTKRKMLFKKYFPLILKRNLVHPKAYLEKHVKLGRANQIFAETYINSNCSIGNNNILNSGCIIEHENRIGNHNHISIGVILGGRVNIGDECFIGAGAVIIDKINICSEVVIGANSVVIKDITESGTYVGNPVKRIK